MNVRKGGMTLIELVVVVIIIGILAGIMVPKYQRSRERAIDKQGQTILVLIRAAERNYFMETSGYYSSTTNPLPVSTINDALNLDLVDDGNWNYKIVDTGGFRATLTRRESAGGYPRSLWINATNVNATCVGTCP